MPLMVEMEVRVGEVPAGSGNTYLAQQQSNVPGQGGTPQARIGFQAQVMQFIVAEGVQVAAGLTTEQAVTTQAIANAMAQCVVDLTNISSFTVTALAAANTNGITAANLATIQGWPTGAP